MNTKSDDRNDTPQPPVEEAVGAATQPLDGAAEGAPQETPPLEDPLQAITRERDEYLDQWRRAAAEFQNFKKREEKLRLERERAANSRLLRRLLPVLDDLQRGAQHVPAELSQDEWVKGILAIERKLWGVLEPEGVVPIEATTGTEFDPAIHEALLSLDSEEVSPGQIVSELERGYRLHDTILRPARVSVAR